MNNIKQIEKINNGFKIEYLIDDKQTKTVIYSQDEYIKMLDLMKQGLKVDGIAINELDPSELNINIKLKQFRTDILDTVKAEVKNIESDYKYLANTVDRTIQTKNTLLTQLNKESEKRINLITSKIEEAKLIEQKALETILNGEKKREEVVSSIKNKTDIAWIDLKRSKEDGNKILKNVKEFKDKLDKDFINIKKDISNNIKELKVINDKIQEEFKKELITNKKEVSDFITKNSERIEKRNIYLKEHNKIKKQKAFFKKEIKLINEREDKKKKIIIKETSNIIEQLNKDIIKLKEDTKIIIDDIKISSINISQEKSILELAFKDNKINLTTDEKDILVEIEQNKTIDTKESKEYVTNFLTSYNNLLQEQKIKRELKEDKLKIKSNKKEAKRRLKNIKKIQKKKNTFKKIVSEK
jgi:hypothetical protein